MIINIHFPIADRNFLGESAKFALRTFIQHTGVSQRTGRWQRRFKRL